MARSRKQWADEREEVQKFIVELQRRANVYVFVDTDSKARLFKSGWDFLVCGPARTVFVEAKVVSGNQNPETKLSPYQKYTRSRIVAAGGVYALLAFRPEQNFLILQSERWKDQAKGEWAIKHLLSCCGAVQK